MMKLVVAIMTVALATQTALANPVLDFGDGGQAGGSIVVSGGNVVGSGIPIDVLKVINVGPFASYDVDGTFVGPGDTAGVLDFDTAANTITITGSVPGLGVGPVTLLSGSFSSWSWDAQALSFNASGPDVKDRALLTALGLNPNTEFAYFGFSIAAKISGGDLIAISTDIKNTAVPEPATLALLGLGLAGMGLIRKRRK